MERRALINKKLQSHLAPISLNSRSNIATMWLCKIVLTDNFSKAALLQPTSASSTLPTQKPINTVSQARTLEKKVQMPPPHQAFNRLTRTRYHCSRLAWRNQRWGWI